jgi:tetratricopeptide (TPR) repeat protein
MTFRSTVLIAFMLASGWARAATPLDEAQNLWLAGHRKEAVAEVSAALKRSPDDLKLRFTLGVYRMEMRELPAALEIFTALTQDFPDLADPYNNLAVIHASQGDLDAARTELEQALRLQPEHAQAQENLGDVMLRLALRAYQRAEKTQIAPSDSLALKLKQTQALVVKLTPTATP